MFISTIVSCFSSLLFASKALTNQGSYRLSVIVTIRTSMFALQKIDVVRSSLSLDVIVL